ncbi:MAG: hypothetical protein Q7U57_18000 [Methylovulum sp.]|nr:hypothetical protein [Methylovulum sp.]
MRYPPVSEQDYLAMDIQGDHIPVSGIGTGMAMNSLYAKILHI